MCARQHSTEFGSRGGRSTSLWSDHAAVHCTIRLWRAPKRQRTASQHAAQALTWVCYRYLNDCTAPGLIRVQLLAAREDADDAAGLRHGLHHGHDRRRSLDEACAAVGGAPHVGALVVRVAAASAPATAATDVAVVLG